MFASAGDGEMALLATRAAAASLDRPGSYPITSMLRSTALYKEARVHSAGDMTWCPSKEQRRQEGEEIQDNHSMEIMIKIDFSEKSRWTEKHKKQAEKTKKGGRKRRRRRRIT